MTSKLPISVRLLTWLSILAVIGIFYGRALLFIEDRYFVALQPDIGVGPIVLRDQWLTNETPVAGRMGLGTRYYIVIEATNSARIQGEFSMGASFRRYPWVILPPTGGSFSNCTFDIHVDAGRYNAVRHDAPAIFVARSAAELGRLLPQF